MPLLDCTLLWSHLKTSQKPIAAASQPRQAYLSVQICLLRSDCFTFHPDLSTFRGSTMIRELLCHT